MSNLEKKLQNMLDHYDQQQPDPNEYKRIMKNTYFKKYYPGFTKNLEEQIKKTLNHRAFLLISGTIGSGKSETIYRVAKTSNWQIIEYSSDTILEDKKDELKTIITSNNNPSLIIIFDNIDKMGLPEWFFRYKDELPKDSFMDIAKKYYKKANIVIIATVTNQYNIIWDLKKQYFDTYLHEPPLKKYMDNVVKKIMGKNLPKGFPRDLHQFHLYIKHGGFHTPYIFSDDEFGAVDRFFKKNFKELPKTRVHLKHWIMINLFQNPYYIPNHSVEFFKFIAILCNNDLYDTDDFFYGIPDLPHVNKYRKSLYYPTYVRDEDEI